MSTQFDLRTISQFPSSRGLVASSTNDSDPQSSKDHDVVPPAQGSPSNPGPTNQLVNDDHPMPRTSSFAPFDEHLNELVATLRWQTDLDDYLTKIFDKSVLSRCLIDSMALRAIQIIGWPIQAKTRSLALAIYTQWMRMQFCYKDANVSAPEIIALISRIADRLGWISVHAQKDFQDELNRLCVEKLKLTWRWYATTTIHEIVPIPRKSLFMRVMAVVAMIGHLSRGGQLQFGPILGGLRYIAIMLPLPDAVAIIYALLHELGVKFALEEAGWHFIQRLLADLLPLTVGRTPVDLLCQLVSAINRLVAKWHDRIRVTSYHAYPENNQFHAHRPQM